MAFSYAQFKTVPEASSLSEANDSNYDTENSVYVPGSVKPREFFPLSYGQRLTRSSEYYRSQSQNPNRLFMIMDQRGYILTNSEELSESNVIMPPPLPPWMWTLLVTTLGIGSKASRKRYCIATLLHIFTLTSAFAFGASGLFFNALDALSEFTKTTVLMCITKSVLGLYWIGLGIYANNLATRLFNNRRMVDCIRFHSKTFLKVSTAFIIILLSVSVVAVNLYSNLYLIEDQMLPNGTVVTNSDANCASIRVNIILCKIYFGSKVIYSCFCLMWNLLVVGIFLSVCRTHTVSLRQLMKELLYDTKIYVEFCRIQALEKQMEMMQTAEDSRQIQQTVDFQSSSDINIWDDDIVGLDHDSGGTSELPPNAQLLQTLRTMRLNSRDQFASDIASSVLDQDVSHNVRNPNNTPNLPREEDEKSESSMEDRKTKHARSDPSDEINITQNQPVDVHENMNGKTAMEPPNKSASSTSEETESKPKVNPQPSASNQQTSKSTFSDFSAPIMSNEELLFIYFQLLRRFASTSRLLQRWISSWITFVMLWCAMLIVYWTSHTAQLSGIIQFLIPLVALGLLASGYAEVNFEGERLIKFVLPTEERMPVIYYFQNSKLELKIFSFTMTYNTIVTVVAGIAVTFATRIILDQFNLDKGHLM